MTIREYIKKISFYNLIKLKYLLFFYFTCMYIIAKNTTTNNEQLLIVGFAWVFIGLEIFKVLENIKKEELKEVSKK